MTGRTVEMTKRNQISPCGRNDREDGRNDREDGRNDKIGCCAKLSSGVEIKRYI